MSTILDAIGVPAAEIVAGIAVHQTLENVVLNKRALHAAAHSTVYRSRRLRVSMSQILTICQDGKYIVCTNPKRPERVTPIGGVVRYFPAIQEKLEVDIGFRPEHSDGEERYDLRGYILGKHFARFLRWYATGLGREQLGLAREIEEELTDMGAKRVKQFVRRPEFVLEREVHEGPTAIPSHGYWQYRFFQVLRLEEEGSGVSRKLADFIRSESKRNSHMALVTSEEIRQGRLIDGRLIGDSCGYLFSHQPQGAPVIPYSSTRD